MKTKQQELVDSNPFYGLSATLDLFQQSPKGIDKTRTNALLNASWKEVNAITDGVRKSEAIQLFYTLVFAIGDVNNREHQLFGKSKVDQGGFGQRETFRYALEWMLSNTPKYFYSFIHLIPEYSNYENLFFNQIRTDRYKGKLISQEALPVDSKLIAEALAKHINSGKVSPFELSLIAKFLPKVPVSKRYRIKKDGTKVAKEKQNFTIEKDKRNLKLIEHFSIAMGFNIKIHDTHVRFLGYEKWRSTFLKDTEAHLFSTKEVIKFDKTQFENWLEQLPAGARFRVQRRLVEKTDKGELKALPKWTLQTGENMGEIYLAWMKNKEAAMKLLVSMSEKEKDQMDVKDLKKLEKAAKVTTGGNTLYEVMINFLKGVNTSEANILAQTLVDKIKLEVPVMVVSDVSGSMNSAFSVAKETSLRLSAIDVARLSTALFLYKNPDPDLQEFFIRFDDHAEVIMDGTPGVAKTNRYMTGRTFIIDKLVNKTLPFMNTYKNVSTQLFARGGTSFNVVADDLNKWANEEGGIYFSIRKELIQKYPVWLVISDGDMNGSGSATNTMRNFQMKMKQYFSFEPVVVVWDVQSNDVAHDKSKFKDLENVMYFGGFNPGVLNSVFLGINDVDIIDVYIPLKTLFASNRYQPVRDVITGETKHKKIAKVSEQTIVI